MLRIIIEPNRNVTNDAKRRIAEFAERHTAPVMIPGAHRVMYPCSCYRCGVSFWSPNEYANLCGRRKCEPYDEDDEVRPLGFVT